MTNSNDSYWLSNPHQPLTGFARIIGDEGTQRSLRTRIGLIMTQSRVSGTDGLGPAGFTVKDMERMVFSDRQYAGELTRDALVSTCRSFSGGMAPTDSGPPVAIGNACDILAKWDLHESLSSKGAGDFDAITTSFTPGQGFSPISAGSSFVQVTSWNKGRCPVGGSVLTYSQSENPASPHFDDQTKLFSQKRWIPDRFCMASVRRDTKRTMVLERAR